MIKMAEKNHVLSSTKPKPIHVFIGLATHDYKVHTQFLLSMMGMVNCGRFKLTLCNTSSGGIHKARNHLAWEFLTKSDAEYYLSADGDIGFTPDQVSRLMAHDKDIVAAPYCHKKPELQWSARGMDGAGVDPATGLQEMVAVGTGFILIKRRVMEKLRDEAQRATNPQRWHLEDWNEAHGQRKWDIFYEGVVCDPEFGYPEPTALTEDWGFCYWARKAGYKILIDSSFHLMHWEGGRGYPEKKPELVSAEETLPQRS